MKKIIASLFAFAAVLAPCSGAMIPSAPDNFVITGTVPNVSDGATVILFQDEGVSGRSIAQDTIVKGRFRLSGILDCDFTQASIMLFDNSETGRSRMLYLRPDAQVEIAASDLFVQTWPVKSNMREQAEYDRFITKSKTILDTLQQRQKDFSWAMHTAPDNATRAALIASFEADKASRDSLEVVVMRNDMELLQQSPVTTVWLDKLEDLASSYKFYENYSESLGESLKELCGKIDGADKNSRQYMRIQALLYPSTQIEVGDTVPDALFKDIEGNSHTLAELRGKWVLLDFWSSGCHGCIAAIPELHKLEENHPDQIAVVSLSVDSDKNWRFGTATHNVKGNNWNEGKEDVGLYKKFDIGGLPVFALISPEGVVKSKWLGFEEGRFERELKLHSRLKKGPEYSAQNGVFSVKQPQYGTNDTSAVLDIENVEVSAKGVTIDFLVTFTPGWWIMISPESFLTTEDGTQLRLIGSEGLTPGEEFYTNENGSGSFSLTFEPLPADSATISFFEGPASTWAIKNIRLHP